MRAACSRCASSIARTARSCASSRSRSRSISTAKTLNGFPYVEKVTGAPILAQAVAYLDCEVRERLEVGEPHALRRRGGRLRLPQGRGDRRAADGGHPHELRGLKRLTTAPETDTRPCSPRSRWSSTGAKGWLSVPALVDDEWLARLRAVTDEFVDASRALTESTPLYDLERRSHRRRAAAAPVQRADRPARRRTGSSRRSR